MLLTAREANSRIVSIYTRREEFDGILDKKEHFDVLVFVMI